MDAIQLDLDPKLVGRLTSPQLTFLHEMQLVLERLHPSRLDLPRSEASLVRGSLSVLLAHAEDPTQDLFGSISGERSTVFYGANHQDFEVDELHQMELWPFPAPDYASAAVRFLEQLLCGRVEMLVRPGHLQERMLTAWIADDGKHQTLSHASHLRVQRHPGPSSIQRWDFGCRT